MEGTHRFLERPRQGIRLAGLHLGLVGQEMGDRRSSTGPMTLKLRPRRVREFILGEWTVSDAMEGDEVALFAGMSPDEVTLAPCHSKADG